MAAFNLLVGDSCIGSIETSLKPNQVLMMWEFWRDEINEGEFREWIVQMGHATPAESGNDLELL